MDLEIFQKIFNLLNIGEIYIWPLVAIVVFAIYKKQQKYSSFLQQQANKRSGQVKRNYFFEPYKLYFKNSGVNFIVYFTGGSGSISRKTIVQIEWPYPNIISLFITPKNIFSKISKIFRQNNLSLGHEKFDSMFFINSDSEFVIRELLSFQMQNTLLNLKSGLPVFNIKNTKFEFYSQNIIENQEDLNQLIDIAEQLFKNILALIFSEKNNLDFNKWMHANILPGLTPEVTNEICKNGIDSFMTAQLVGYSFINQKKYNEAISILKNALANKSIIDDGTLNSMLGMAYLKNESYEEAVSAYEKAIGLATNNDIRSQACNNCGGALQKIGKLKEALSKYEQNLKLNPNKHIYQYNVGQVYALMGNTNYACKHLGKSLELNPNVLPHLLADPDLDSIRNSEAYIQMMKACKK
jgi:tetratricopeptide (TPR) repeat protein